MANEIITIRVLQHDTEDLIRIGMAVPTLSIEETVQRVIKQYEVDCTWCGGFKAACESYYKRIAIVNADTLEVIHTIYQKESSDGSNSR